MRMSDFALAGNIGARAPVDPLREEAAESVGTGAAAAEVARNCRREIAVSIMLVGVDELVCIQQRVTKILKRAVGVAVTNTTL